MASDGDSSDGDGDPPPEGFIPPPPWKIMIVRTRLIRDDSTKCVIEACSARISNGALVLALSLTVSSMLRVGASLQPRVGRHAMGWVVSSCRRQAASGGVQWEHAVRSGEQ